MDDACHDRSVARQVVAGDEGERPGVGCTSGGEPGHELAWRGSDAGRGAAAQRVDVRDDGRIVAIQPAAGPAQVAGLGRRDGHGGDVRRGEVAQPRLGVVAGVRAGHAADDLEAVAVRGPADERVEPILKGHRVAEPGPATDEGSGAPVGRVRRVPGVPGLVGTEEVAQTEVDQRHRSGGRRCRAIIAVSHREVLRPRVGDPMRHPAGTCPRVSQAQRRWLQEETRPRRCPPVYRYLRNER